MSVQRVGTNVVCDGPITDEDCPDNASFMDAVSAEEIRARLVAEEGWVTGLPGGIDRCKACQDLKAGFQKWLADKALTASGSNPAGGAS